MHKRHTIWKQVLEVETVDPSAKMGFQQEVYDLFTDMLLPQMESLFDRTAGPGMVIRSEKVEIRVTLPYSKNWKDKLCESVVRELEQALQNITPICLSADPDQRPPGRTLLEPGGAFYNIPPEHRTTGAEPPAPPGDAEAIILYFLSNGILPWYAAQWSLDSLKAHILQVRQATAGPPYKPHSFEDRLLRLLTSRPKAVSRLISQFGESFLTDFFSQTLEYKMLQRWRFLLALLPDQTGWTTLLPFLTYSDIQVSSAPAVEKKLLLTLLRTIPKDSLAAWWNEDASTNQQHKLRRVLGASRESDILPLLEGVALPEHKPAVQLAKDRERTLSQELNEEGVYIDNAGLVILHPFLAPLFTALGYWDGRSFSSGILHQKAVLLSQYMIFPGEDFPEHQLLLNKVLCGYDPEETLLSSLNFGEEEVQQSRELLGAVIRYWTLNGNQVCTTEENLRASFLQRPGKLIRRSGEWFLQVEKKGYDIVLKGLPWGIGIIKHPWMPEMLKVEWA